MRLRTSGLKLLSALTAIYLSLCLILYLQQDGLIFYPQPLHDNITQQAGIKRQAIELVHQGTALHGWLLNRKAENLLIYYGGNAEEVSYQIPLFSQLDTYAVLLLNYRGYGTSEGKPGEKALIEDALYIFDQAETLLGRKPEKTTLMGRSLGSGIAIQVASQRQVDQVILVTPYASILAMAKDLYPWLPVSWLLNHPFDSVRHIPKVTAPLLVLLAEQDNVVPHNSSRNLIAAAQSPLQSHIIANSNHVTITDTPEFIQLVRSFLSQ